MAPITQIKRNQTQQQHIKDTAGGGVHSYSHANGVHNGHNNAAKENANHAEKQQQPANKKGLEILDFHESWLEEMEIYKDQMYMHNKHHHSNNHHYQQQQHQQQQQQHFIQQQLLINAHNAATHAGHVAAAHIDLLRNSNNYNNIDIRQNIAASAAAATAAGNNLNDNSATAATKLNAMQNSIAKRKGSEHISNISVQKRSPRSRSSELKQNNTGNVQLLLKRPREEVTASKSASAATNAASVAAAATAANNTANSNNINNSGKRHNHSNNNTHSHSHSNSPPASSSTKSSGISASSPHLQDTNTANNNNNNNNNAAQPPPHTGNTGSKSKPTSKIIVNQFHASSLLSSQHLDEKNKILTQNGLAKSAATAYETSVYASNYLPQDHHNRTAMSMVNGVRYPHADYTNYNGVSLAKHDNNNQQAERSGRDSSHSHSHSNNEEDDPCAAIDDINDYSETDSDEEYSGYPFFLASDGNETHQSRNIRYKVERASDYTALENEPGCTQYYTPDSILSPSIFPNVPPFLNFASHSAKGAPMPPALHKVLKWKLSPVMPKIVKRVVLNSGFRIIKNTTDWMAIWEKHMKSPGFRTIRSHQKYNHMPGSFRIGRKDSMWRSIHNNVKRYGSKEFGFMQKSYIMPDDLENLRRVWPKNASKLTKWIVKPPASARGTGIRIVNKWSQFPKDRPLVVQKYIERPLLINDNKFDMRIYVVLTSINPLRIYMYKDGLARFASVKYSSELTSLDDRCMHLTNYSINKFSQNYSKNEDFNACQGHKWTLQSLWSCLEARGVNTKRLWATLRNLVIKAIISGESGLNRMYRQNVNFRYNCFELFGFDVLLDENIIPWLLEINISPSLHSELPLDLHVKGPLIQALLNTALYQVPPKLNERQQKEILTELNMEGPLCHDKRIFTTCLTAEEVRKHNQFTNRSIEFREEYTDSILENLLPDDVRCLIVAEDEFARSKPLERIFPTRDTHIYLKFIENPRYYNRLLDAWEHRFAECREHGIALLSRYCKENYHLQVSEAALEKEPNVAMTEIDMLHVKKSDDTLMPASVDSQPDDGGVNISAHASKAGSPDSTADSITSTVLSLGSPITTISSTNSRSKSSSKETSEQTIKSSKKHLRQLIIS